MVVEEKEIMASEDYWLGESIFGIPVVRETFQRVRTDAALPLSWHGTIPIPQGYALEKLLGTGSFGTVVLLRKQDDPAASPLALKILAKDILAQTYRDRLPEDSCGMSKEKKTQLHFFLIL
ncbi:MAG: hypothetical protein Q8P67_08895, partial [archaeon]|nr:hypothetical protein [archaeon]